MKPKPQSRRRPAGGFTLTELLVVKGTRLSWEMMDRQWVVG